MYEPEPGLWEVIDFKSGRRRDDPSQRVQLQAYALAVHEAGLSADPPQRTRVGFAYFGGGFEEVSEEVDASWLDQARSHLQDLVTGASEGRFAEAPSPACRHCDFARFCPAGTAWLAENEE